MSTFKVSIEKIDKIWQHPNADKLELASVEGMTFQFVIPKDTYKLGDKVVYFPIDSVLPDTLIEKFNIRNFLAGSKKDRLKTCTLRKEISQGYVSKLDAVFPGEHLEVGTDVTEKLGVIKYEQPEVVCKAGRLTQLPNGVAVYDIEGVDRYPKTLDKLMHMLVAIWEKVEGSNSGILLTKNGDLHFFQRRFEVKPEPDCDTVHDWIRVPTESGLVDKLKKIQTDLYPNKDITIRLEMVGCGIQGNIYKLSKLKQLAFDIQVDGQYIDSDKFIDICKTYDIETCPLLFVNKTLNEILNGKSVKDLSHGQSVLYPTLREGIVIKPIKEQYDEYLKGRLILKLRDPIYLDKTGN